MDPIWSLPLSDRVRWRCVSCEPVGCPKVDCGSLTGGAYGWADGVAKPYFGLVAGTTSASAAWTSSGARAGPHPRGRHLMPLSSVIAIVWIAPGRGSSPLLLTVHGRDTHIRIWHDRGPRGQSIEPPPHTEPEPRTRTDEDPPRRGRRAPRPIACAA